MSDGTNGKGARESWRDEAGLTPAQRTWLEHIRQCDEEGLTYKAYCEREGLEVGGLYSARRKLLKRGRMASAAGASPRPPRAGASPWPPRAGASPWPPRFAAVRLAQPDVAGTVEVMLPNGVQMRATLHDADGLVRLVQGLGQLPK